ncbi:NAD(P)-dependent dehydrogenase (short-subunit alcohol dehydrogenase family) [Kineosphaera limosa]|uniref:Putative oxidoreductase n=1 Tax=Kineosphaera limosa NBRC 100340 TaxID=1184609 RepID=K6WE58_9MICO|nr:SDR family oxidoreductase [Kineosphaera limosa]NYE01180.1 NAD(P)-dependent dehydrogenase (short-subunit alcohol dehydrogenase family) [Kineosphaera limosa]GAB97585.1 putative oxidoreductase [Kineosphaera limosa NBRC 100340]
MQDFDSLIALVTGGASGIGAAVAEELQRRGARVAVLDLDPTQVVASDRLRGWTCDVADTTSVNVAVAEAAEHFGGLDIVVNNAGIGAAGGIDDNTPQEWQRVFDVNVIGIRRVVGAALPHLLRSPAAAIVNVGSIAATQGLPQRALYSATKGAVHALTRAMACDLLDEGVRVNAVSPGTADTPWVGRLLSVAPDPAAERAALEARQPHGRLVSAAEVAAAVAYLASPQAGSTNGVCLAVDGGSDNVIRRPR